MDHALVVEVAIRAARLDERDLLATVEAASGRLFADIGMPEIADGEPLWLDAWGEVADAGLVFVAEADGAVVGFVLCELLDGALHVEQLSVDPAFGRRGIGSALVHRACTEASRRGLANVTLSTFRDVPFNGPFYRRLGFVEVPDHELTPGLRVRRDHEAAEGLDPATRAMMRLSV